MFSTTAHFKGKRDNATIQRTFSSIQSFIQNSSHHDGCMELEINGNLSVDSPDITEHAEMEEITRRVLDNLLGFLFLIGGPGNVINMAVFYKQGLKDRVNLCLFALSLADEVYLIAETLFHCEQLYLQFTTKESYGPMHIFLVNRNVTGLTGCTFVSLILSAIIASERFLCVFSPLRFQTLLRTRTMAAIIIAVYVTVLGLFFVVATQYRIRCFYNPESGEVFKRHVAGDFYKAHKDFINPLDSFVFGAGLPGLVIIVVITTTIATSVKLREIVKWRTDTSSQLSSREIKLTKMLIGNSIFFIICAFPVAVTRFSWLFVPEMRPGGRYQNLFFSSLWIYIMFSCTNSTFNIFVYYAMGSRYRETFWALFNRRNKQPDKK